MYNVLRVATFLFLWWVFFTYLAGCEKPASVCEPTSQRCVDGLVMTCSSGGVWMVTLECPGGTECVEMPADRFGAAGPACVAVSR